MLENFIMPAIAIAAILPPSSFRERAEANFAAIFPRESCRQLRHDLPARELPPTSPPSSRKRAAANFAVIFREKAATNFAVIFPLESCRQLRRDLTSKNALLGKGHQILAIIFSLAPLITLARWRGFYQDSCDNNFRHFPKKALHESS